MIKNCSICGKEFHVKPSTLKLGRGKYCSGACKGIAFSRITGANHPLWKGGIDKRTSEENRERRRIYYKNNKERLCKHWNDYARNYRNKISIEVLKHYGDRCACISCGFNDFNFKIRNKRFLQIDHINGGGNKENERIMKEGYRGIHEYLKRKNYPTGYRILCGGCNPSMQTSEFICELHKWELKKKNIDWHVILPESNILTWKDVFSYKGGEIA